MYARCATGFCLPRAALWVGVSLLLLRVRRSGQGKDNVVKTRDEEEEYDDEETKEEKPGKEEKEEITYF